MLCESYIVSVKFCYVLLLLVACARGQASPASLDAGFDKPLKTAVVDLGPSPYYKPSRKVRKKLSCFYYSKFAVKEYDEGQKGAEWLSIVSSSSAPCALAHRADEKVIESQEWSGYFWGAKDNYAIFGAPDGTDGGLPFVVFDVNKGRRICEDSSILDYYEKALHLTDTFRISSGSEHAPRLTYFRVVRAQCNLKQKPAECWNKVRQEFGIPQTDIPVCSGYERADWDSAVAYHASVLLVEPLTISSIDGPVSCWPTD
ncbi:hypothetical protein Acid345_2422 [Candidatus Koribacter versatilis Ellin345]|uniref:Uncharacterized protein n=1 Tax=Koribacter versatilis (strain Ellin345) TaxID=204669 RepID=Q1INX7_KORVE|nr:hypothetical protein [Candidatus Koribacter versatilis]ABF41423.1 hypothetical protein Acid345_2422 [Candidatus Koribacter versatilis Ellin345]